ncbi:MAG TPA: hypothetical protein VGO40_09310 [Longimicrobium sp.]|jgi:hypothetical protein|nr:hypothetical protein [Longimicrobium sp.]
MINLLQAIRDKTETWMVTWVELISAPKAFFATLDRTESHLLVLPQSDSSPGVKLPSLEFFWGAQVVAYLSAAICAISFFMDVHAPALNSHLADASRGFGAVTTVIGVAVLGRLLALWLVGAVSFGAYRISGSRTDFRHHVRVLHYLTSFDFLPAAIMTLLIMFQDPYINNLQASWDYLSHNPLSSALLIVWCLVLVYNLVISYIALGVVHGQTSSRRRMTFIVGFTPIFLIITIISTWFAARLVALALVKNFD